MGMRRVSNVITDFIIKYVRRCPKLPCEINISHHRGADNCEQLLKRQCATLESSATMEVKKLRRVSLAQLLFADSSDEDSDEDENLIMTCIVKQRVRRLTGVVKRVERRKLNRALSF